MPTRNKSGLRGVYWDKERHRWMGTVTHNGRAYKTLRFKTIEEAEAAVIAKRNELFTRNDLDRKPAV